MMNDKNVQKFWHIKKLTRSRYGIDQIALTLDFHTNKSRKKKYTAAATYIEAK